MLRHVAGIAEIVEDIEAAVNFYRDVLQLTVEFEEGSGYADVMITGVLHFGIWSRTRAAEVIYGDVKAVDRVPLGFTIGFEVDDVLKVSEVIRSQEGRMIQAPKDETWGQRTSRFFSLSGALFELSETPTSRKIIQPVKAI
ncbi:MAG: VOC family protein [Candidatus Bathyarchaeota archaeon]|nr:MAG: VOC family protein [Candidatus Bathyarchaeota archaeon]